MDDRAHDDTRVLVVDDSPASRAVARAVIDATAGFVMVGGVSTGEAALAWLGGHRADLVLMDVRMPGIGGVAAARAVRSLPGAPPVVLVSGDECADIAADPAAHGAVAFLPKEALGSRALERVAG